MKTLLLDLSMGAAGDMMTAALSELLEEDKKPAFIDKLNSAGIPHVEYIPEKVSKCGIVGTHMAVKVHGHEEGEHHHDGEHHEHHHHSIAEVEQTIDSLSLSGKVKAQAKEVYRLIAEAESKVHGTEVSQVHFHEVGSLDAIADVVAVCALMEELKIEKVCATAVHVGSGQVKCAHGILPVPAPATALLLCGVPMYSKDIEGELCTPTGAALLKYFVDDFGGMPTMTAEKIGYGMGKKDFSRPNCLRAILGETADGGDSVFELCCNIDDMSGEKIAFAMEKLLEGGALDAYTIPIGMKKSRPAVMLCVLCREEDKDRIIRLIFRHTSTIGIRESRLNRYTLSRHSEEIETPWGTVRRKISSGYGVTRSKYEFDDLAKVAESQNISLEEAEKLITDLNIF